MALSFLHFRASTTIGIASEIFRLALCRAKLFSQVIVPVRIGWPKFMHKNSYPTAIYLVLKGADILQGKGWRFHFARYEAMLAQFSDSINARLRFTTSIATCSPKGQEGLYLNNPALYQKITGNTDFARMRRVARAVRDFGIVELNANSASQCEQALKGIGIGINEWFVCLHVRTSKFHSDVADYRNALFENYEAAIDYIHHMGGKVVRMGDIGPVIVRSIRPGLIDYPNTQFKSELMDLYLIKHCRFYIGTLSGILDTAYLMKTPTLCVNSLQFDLRSPNSKDRMLYKHIVHKESKKILTFTQAMSQYQEILSADWLSQYDVIENTSDEILSATKEFIEVLTTNKEPTMRQVQARRTLIRNRLKYAAQNGSLFSLLSASIAFSRCQVCNFYLKGTDSR